MLIKLLKYEFKFTARSLLPIYAALLALTVLFNLGDGMRFDFTAAGTFGDLLFTLLVIAYSCVISAVCIITVILLVQRFYKNLLRDEGYLMHTLPVSPGQNIAAKLISAVAWSVVSLLVAGVSLMFTGMDWYAWQTFFREFGTFIQALNEAFGVHWLLFLLETVLVGLTMLGASIIKVYFALTVGHMANNHKIACSVAAYIGVEIFDALLTQLFGRIVVNWRWLVNLLNEIFNGFVHQQIVGVHMILLGTLGFFLVYTMAMFMATNWLMKHRLNLE